MATRFRFHSSGTPAITPSFDASWEQTGQATRLPMDRSNGLRVLTPLTTSASITIPITTTQNILAYQFISNDIFIPQRVPAGTFALVLRCSENANTNNAFLNWTLKGVSADGQRELGILQQTMSAGAGTEFPVTASAATRIATGTPTVTSTTMNEPWRMVLEIGVGASAPSAAGSYQMRVGCDATTDFANTAGLTTDLNPWMEISIANDTGWGLNSTKLNNYHSVRAANGLSTSGAAR